MNKQIVITIVAATLVASGTASHASAVEGLLSDYRSQGAKLFSASGGEQLWLSKHEGRSCSNCHTLDPKRQGKHQKTGKTIHPLAPSINRERLSNEKTIKKWLKRNCKWTLGRECSPQEKGDFLTWLQTQ